MYTVLIADDERLERTALQSIIADSGLPLTCVEAKNGREAVETVASGVVNIAFLDIQMPVIDGMEAARRIKAQNPDCRIVFLTAWRTFDYAQEAISLGVKFYLVKPVDGSELTACLQKLVKDLDETASHQTKVAVSDEAAPLEKDFFYSIKYGGLAPEKIDEWLKLRHIPVQSGKTYVCSLTDPSPVIRSGFLTEFAQNCRQNHFYEASFAEQGSGSPGEYVCHLFVFGSVQSLAAAEPDFAHFTESYRGFRCGSGRVFSTGTEIARSLQEASLAWMETSPETPVIAYTPLLAPLAGTETGALAELEQNIISAVLDRRCEDALNLADSYIGRIMLDFEQKSTVCRRRLSELIVVLTRTVQYKYHVSIPGLSSSASIPEMRVYLSQFIPAACDAIAADRCNKYGRTFRMVEDYLKTHYAGDISLDMMSTMVGVDPDYFSKLFKKYTGVHFVDYLTRIRMDAAQQLLEQGKTVAQSAELCGYHDPAYFSRIFRKQFGISPKKAQLDKK